MQKWILLKVNGFCIHQMIKDCALEIFWIFGWVLRWSFFVHFICLLCSFCVDTLYQRMADRTQHHLTPASHIASHTSFGILHLFIHHFLHRHHRQPTQSQVQVVLYFHFSIRRYSIRMPFRFRLQFKNADENGLRLK